MKDDLVDRLVESLLETVMRDCAIRVRGEAGKPLEMILDSMLSQTYADAIRLLAECGKVRITHEDGHHVIAKYSSRRDA